MLRGYIDGMSGPDIIEGWALDEDTPWQPLDVKIRYEGDWIASGLAHHFREDLLLADIGTGWCGFRLRLEHVTPSIRNATLYLVAASGGVIVKSDTRAMLPLVNEDLRTVEDISASDPTVTSSVEQLRGCEHLFTQFIRRYGIDAFVRAAYVYMLSRPADENGLQLYGNRLRRGSHRPFELLQILAGSDEFTARRPQLVAPTQSSFPFLIE